MEAFRKSGQDSQNLEVWSWAISWILLSLVVSVLGSWQTGQVATDVIWYRWGLLSLILAPVTYFSAHLYYRNRSLFIPFVWAALAIVARSTLFLRTYDNFASGYLAQALLIPAIVFFLIGALYVALLHTVSVLQARNQNAR